MLLAGAQPRLRALPLVLAAVLLAAAPRCASGVLQFDYLNVYSCPPGACLGQRCARMGAHASHASHASRVGCTCECSHGGNSPRGSRTPTKSHRASPLSVARATRPRQPGFAGPAASFLECRPRGGGVASGSAAAPAAMATPPTVINSVYAPGTLAAGVATQPATLCDARAAGYSGFALLVSFKAGSACNGPSDGAPPLPLDGACRRQADGANKPYRRETLRCVAGAQPEAQACDDDACSRGCVPVVPMATMPLGACVGGRSTICSSLAPAAAPSAPAPSASGR